MAASTGVERSYALSPIPQSLVKASHAPGQLDSQCFHAMDS